jgi:hypothetical protein
MIFIRRHGKGERSAKAHLAHRMYCIHKGLRSATVEDGLGGVPWPHPQAANSSAWVWHEPKDLGPEGGKLCWTGLLVECVWRALQSRAMTPLWIEHERSPSIQSGVAALTGSDAA